MTALLEYINLYCIYKYPVVIIQASYIQLLLFDVLGGYQQKNICLAGVKPPLLSPLTLQVAICTPFYSFKS